MKQYDVKISRMALSDMEQIYSYIADRLLESDTAMRQYDRIAEAIQSLNILPERCALVESEPERTQGLRQMVFQAGFKMGANKTCARFRVKTPEGTTQTVVFFGDMEKLGAFLDEKYGAGSEEALYAGKGNFPLSVVYQVSQNTYKGKTEVQFVMQNYC